MDESHDERTWKISLGVQRHKSYKYDRIHGFGQNCEYFEGKVVTHARIVVDYCPQKKRQNRVRITAGRNAINYPDKLATRTADITTSTSVWNSAMFTRGSRCICSDAKNLYVATPLKDPEYMCIAAKSVPQEFIEMYKLQDKIKNGYIYMRIIRGLYGVPQAGRLANGLLRQRLAEEDYFEVDHTPSLFKHKWRPIYFTLVVDDFGIKHVGEEHRDHLLNILNKYYKIETD